MKKFRKWLSDALIIVDSKSRKLLFLSSLLGFLWFGVELSFVYILQGFLLSLNILSPGQLKVPPWFPLGIYQSTLLLITFGILRSALNYFKSYFSIVAMHSFIRSCREQLTEYGLDSNLFLSSSEYLTLFAERVNQSGVFVQYISLGLVSICSVFLFFVFGVFYAPKEMLFSLSVTILLMIPIKKMTHKIQGYGESLIEEWNQINENVLSSKRNLFFLSVYNLIKFKKDEIHKSLKEYESHYAKYASVASIISSVPLFVGVSVLSICTYLSITYFHTEGVKVLSFFYIFLRLVQGLSELNTTVGALKLTQPFFSNVRDVIIELREKKVQEEESIKWQGFEKRINNVEIVFESLSFAYPNKLPLYENMDFRMSLGDILVIKGPSGSGKSTLLKLLLNLENPTKGRILINGSDVRELNPNWKQFLGYVGPDPYLIKGSIRNNLEFGNFDVSNLTDGDYWEALTMAGLSAEFRASKIDLDTMLSELSFLSTGQKQRLAIARAFLRKPLFVIFDEATANLDSVTEQQILESLVKLSSGIVTIIVTHKNSFDKIGTKFISVGD